MYAVYSAKKKADHLLFWDLSGMIFQGGPAHDDCRFRFVSCFPHPIFDIHVMITGSHHVSFLLKAQKA
jgi:hypothetical protein